MFGISIQVSIVFSLNLIAVDYSTISASCIQVLTPHPEAVHGLHWINESVFMTGCDSGNVIVHDTRAEAPVCKYQLGSNMSTFLKSAGTDLSNGKIGVFCLTTLIDSFINNTVVGMAGCSSGYSSIFDVFTGKIFLTERLHGDDIRCIRTVTGSASNSNSFFDNTVLTGSYDNKAALWKLSSGNGVSSPLYGVNKISELAGHDDKVLSLSPITCDKINGRDELDLVSTGADGKIIWWSISV